MFKGMLLCFILFILSCTSLKDVKLQENPQFISQSDKLLITSPLSYESDAFNSFIIENPELHQIYNVTPEIEDTLVDARILETERIDKTDHVKSEEKTSYAFGITNPYDSIGYRVSGETYDFISKEEKAKSSFEISDRLYPIIFSISQEDTAIGRIIINRPGMKGQMLSVTIETEWYTDKFTIEYQNMLSKKNIAFENEQGLLLLITLKPEKFIAFKLKGEAYLKQKLPDNVKADLLTLFMITDTAMSMVNWGF